MCLTKRRMKIKTIKLTLTSFFFPKIIGWVLKKCVILVVPVLMFECITDEKYTLNTIIIYIVLFYIVPTKDVLFLLAKVQICIPVCEISHFKSDKFSY